MNVKIRAYVQKYGTHSTSLLLRRVSIEGLGDLHRAPDVLDEMARELSEALEEVLVEDPSSGH